MRICIPTQSDQGLAAIPYGHFGSAPYFTLVNIDTNEVEVVSNRGAQHEHGQCHPLRWLSAHRFDAVVCRGMGRRALAMLNQEGVEVLVTEAPTVSAVVRAVSGGEATRLTAAHACQGGHGHGHGHGHG